LQCAKIDLPWMEPGRIRPAVTWQWAEGAVPYMAGRMADSVMEVLKEHKVEKEKIGIDNLDMPAFEALTSWASTSSTAGRRCRARASSRRPTRSSS
jgi:hypothetical protein